MIDKLKDYVDFLSVHQQKKIPFLRQLLDASIKQTVVIISYDRNTNPINLSNINLKNRFIILNDNKKTFELIQCIKENLNIILNLYK